MIYRQRNLFPKFLRTYSSIITENRKEKFIKHFSRISQTLKEKEDNFNSSISDRFKNGNIERRNGDCSVLVPLVDIDNETHLIYTQRSMSMRTHKGQICFPGGRLDSNETWEMAALREAQEEINLKSHDIDVWTLMKPIADKEMTYAITPIVGQVITPDAIKHLHSVTEEVDVVIAVPIMELVTNHHYSFLKLKVSLKIPYYESKHYKVLHARQDNFTRPDFYRIWGLTGVITHQFLLYFTPEIYKSKVDLKF
ncbi:Nucleoside diphosphate-linked moiety X motif 8, mitochondrial [Strongyloides ratti]|uniref:Nucleoside diphosphate-linked moiety X motif 8, mitochondrial n=1 Tax=Strongyloides ratti TaxID=34506 RepID=A0A090L1R4_STRRB|nr:Nucleoside diphosphate-linked moiety X motif 8, mitochondrial [Strongyloides ratti]CEF62062.1 Nucleoside diphosphate-linked moiety X motif 8, mitochondrial [Strongyloides ratti]